MKYFIVLYDAVKASSYRWNKMYKSSLTSSAVIQSMLVHIVSLFPRWACYILLLFPRMTVGGSNSGRVKRTKYLLRKAARLIHSSSGYGARPSAYYTYYGDTFFYVAKIENCDKSSFRTWICLRKNVNINQQKSLV